jgi:hypothetical protein
MTCPKKPVHLKRQSLAYFGTLGTQSPEPKNCSGVFSPSELCGRNDDSRQISALCFPTFGLYLFNLFGLSQRFPKSRTFGHFSMTYWDDDTRRVECIFGVDRFRQSFVALVLRILGISFAVQSTFLGLSDPH